LAASLSRDAMSLAFYLVTTYSAPFFRDVLDDLRTLRTVKIPPYRGMLPGGFRQIAPPRICISSLEPDSGNGPVPSLRSRVIPHGPEGGVK
jgi:hypothetical protein